MRRFRISRARRIADHSPAEWKLLKIEFGNRCVKCGAAHTPLDKDHIVPLYCGGDNGIKNIQPLCPSCNAAKGFDFTDWKEFRRKVGF
jgi:5-methylcytosine-specific restriction endonuclease McrA